MFKIHSCILLQFEGTFTEKKKLKNYLRIIYFMSSPQLLNPIRLVGKSLPRRNYTVKSPNYFSIVGVCVFIYVKV